MFVSMPLNDLERYSKTKRDSKATQSSMTRALLDRYFDSGCKREVELKAKSCSGSNQATGECQIHL